MSLCLSSAYLCDVSSSEWVKIFECHLLDTVVRECETKTGYERCRPNKGSYHSWRAGKRHYFMWPLVLSWPVPQSFSVLTYSEVVSLALTSATTYDIGARVFSASVQKLEGARDFYST
ncbi:unnamed protein product [Ectocarpus sp. 4 AP-2014]